MKLYENNGKQYEIKLVEGHELIESIDKPGPGWVQFNQDIVNAVKEAYSVDTSWREEVIKQILEAEEELTTRRNLGENI